MPSLLEDLRELRELLVAQTQAVAQDDLDGLAELERRRTAVQGRLDTPSGARLGPGDRAEARALAELLVLQQERLEVAAAWARDRVGAELAAIGRGRVAVSGYRPAPRASARYLDSCG